MDKLTSASSNSPEPNRRITIGFRLPPPELRELENLAKESRTSLHDCAKELVRSALRGEPNPSLPSTQSEAIAVAALRSDLAVMFEALLIATKVFGPEEARRFVTEKLPVKSP